MSIINEVKQKTDIVEVISDYVSLQKAGRNFKALCPFHSEKHASFFVFPEQQSWHCFGACGTGGDIFSFVMKREGLDFGQALRLLAQRAGITLTSPEMQATAEDKRKERLFRINEATAEFYHRLLLDTKAGELARNYLSHRKVTLQTIKSFHLGFSPDSWEALKEWLLGKGYEERDLLQAGVIIEKEGGGSYDRFRKRLMFPISDLQGRVIGFGARALDDSLPKYINSPQTPVFDKSGSLYGIDKASPATRQKNLIIIVEGYMDAITAHQHGFQNVVASMGTSLTEKQVDVARRLSKNITLALDADAAGEQATLRSAEMLTQSSDKKVIPVPTWSGLVKYENILDTEIRVIPLPEGKDPDEVISEDPTLWQNLAQQAPLMLDFAFQSVISRVDLNKAKDKSLAMQKLLPLIGEIRDPLRQAHYRQKLAHLLKVSEATLTAALKKSQSSRMRRQPTEIVGQPGFAHQFVSNPIEEYCLALLLQYPQLRQAAQDLSAEHFETTENREVFTKWQCSRDTTELESELDASLLEHLDYLMNRTFPPAIQQNDEARQRTLGDCILRLQEALSKRLEARIEAVLNLEREAEGTQAELAKLEQEGIRPGQQLQQIFAKQKEKQSNRG